MNLDLTEDQIVIRDAVRELCQGRVRRAGRDLGS
jgi:hypothetical protein